MGRARAVVWVEAVGGPRRPPVRSTGVVRIAEVTDIDDVVVEGLVRLVPQLSSSASLPTADTLAEVAAAPVTRLLVARDDGGRVVGTLTLAVFRIPSGVRAWIEDVVTDEAARGQGVGESLTRRAVELAAQAGARSVELTSRPSREAANRLYARMGFQRRDTNVYRLDLAAEPG